MGFRLLKGLTFLSALFLVMACKIHLPTNEIIVDGGVNQSLSCLAQVSNGNLFAPGQPVTIKVTASNGSAPYTLTGLAGNFALSTTITRTYSNITSRQIVISDQVSLSDSQGNNALCTFNVNVTAVVIDPLPLTCQMVGTPQNALIGQNVSYAITATGMGALTFSNFQGGSDSTVVTALTAQNNSASAVVSYAAAGTKTASVTVSDSNGNVAACSDTTVVNSTATVALSPSPSASVAVGSSITLTATPSGFSSTPSLTFTTTEPGVSISTLSANSVRIDALDNLPHSNFTVLVTAAGGTQSATNSAVLSFTSASTLACNISYAAGTYHVGDTVSVNVVAATNETLNITYFSAPGSTALPSFAAFPKPLQYSTAGTKYIYALAKSATTGTLCNGGAMMQTTIEILPSTTTAGCSIVTSPNPAYAGTYFNVSVSPTSYNGYQRIYIIDARDATTGSQAYGQWHYSSSPLTAATMIYYPGTYNLTVTILDELTNTTSSCVTQQQIN